MPLQAQCWRYSALRALVLLLAGMCLTIAAIVFTILVIFHSYLAATNQTTYEMMKRKLSPEYYTLVASRCCGQYNVLLHCTVIKLQTAGDYSDRSYDSVLLCCLGK